MQQYEFHTPLPTSTRPWQSLEPGIDELILNHDPTTGRRTTLQRWQPGARNAATSLHDYFEEVILLEGDLRVVPGKGTAEGQPGETEVWGKGAYAFRRPGMVHGPFASEAGCLMFISCTWGEKG
ncbi:hypothetical protein EV356DRAFT_382563 [Viridothelium virens]|uniref:ChrR-like cupin domain-containing protein n=1 Tax=Viridothelium virens TaxID=1048519 RepID=A0A6A6HI69_VIRVR|nr:hypothetical protein EV356DRAFT_382563 [Viridothelium virens]